MDIVKKDKFAGKLVILNEDIFSYHRLSDGFLRSFFKTIPSGNVIMFLKTETSDPYPSLVNALVLYNGKLLYFAFAGIRFYSTFTVLD